MILDFVIIAVYLILPKLSHSSSSSSSSTPITTKEKVSSLQAIMSTRDVNTRVHIFAATALRICRMSSHTLGHIFPRESPVLILQEVEWIWVLVWTRRSEEKSPPLRCKESNSGNPIRIQASCSLNHLAHTTATTSTTSTISTSITTSTAAVAAAATATTQFIFYFWKQISKFGWASMRLGTPR